jgi:hypothetical protein
MSRVARTRARACGARKWEDVNSEETRFERNNDVANRLYRVVIEKGYPKNGKPLGLTIRIDR